MSLQAEGGDGDQDEEQRRKGNELEERKREKQKKNLCYISNSLNLDILHTGSGYIHQDQSIHLLLRKRVNSDKSN